MRKTSAESQMLVGCSFSLFNLVEDASFSPEFSHEVQSTPETELQLKHILSLVFRKGNLKKNKTGSRSKANVKKKN